MQEELKNKGDNFEKIIRQKLENHQIPVNADIWAGIEAGLNQKKKKNRVIPFWWWFPLGSAAVLALLFTLSPFSGNRPENVAKQNIHPIEKTVNQKDTIILKHKETEKAVTAASIYSIRKNSKKELATGTSGKSSGSAKKEYGFNSETKAVDTVKVIITEKPENSDREIALANTTEISGNSLTEKPTEKELFANSEISQDWVEAGKAHEKVSKKGTVSDVKPNTKKTLIADNSLTKDWVDEKNNKTSKASKEIWLAASVGSGNSVSTSYSGELTANNPYENIVSSGTDYTSTYTPSDFTSREYLPQLSFGLTVQKKIDKVVGLETGLIYTYLQSNFSNPGNSAYDAQLNLHYLGVPVNLILQLTQNKHWNIYLSGGGTIEKGLRSVYIEHKSIYNQIITTRAATNIDGMQYSLSGSLGVSYKIQRNIDIYFEPKFSYYLDNDQPISTRTDHPLVIGINGGLRFGL